MQGMQVKTFVDPRIKRAPSWRSPMTTALDQTPHMSVTIRKLLARDAVISIELGRLIILQRDGQPAPVGWLEQYSDVLVREILVALGIEAYRYESYSTGFYGAVKASGLTLLLSSVRDDSDAYAIFNVCLTRSKTTKAGAEGTPLPKRHFRLKGKRGHFYRFWLSTGLREPRRISSFHDYMGHLKGILFTAKVTDGHPNRLECGTLKPLSISPAEIQEAFRPDISCTTSGHPTDNCRTHLPDKEYALALVNRGLQPEFTTCAEKHGKTVISSHGNSPSLSPRRKTPQEQTSEEWEADYSGTA